MPMTRESEPSGVPPGRALRAGLVFVGVLLLAANLRAGITAVGPVLDPIRADLGIGGSAASLLISLPLIAFAAISPVAPTLARRIGLERALGGSLLALAAAIVLRSVPVPGMIWIGTALLGVAIAILNVLLPALVKREYPDQVGRITGIYTAVQSGVAAVAAGLAVPIADATGAGWRLSLGIWAGLALIGFAVFLPQIRARYRPRAGGPPVDPAEALRGTGTAADDYPVEPVAPDPRLRSSAVAWQVTLFLGLQSTVYYTVITWWPTIEQDHGISAAAAGWHQLVFQLLGIAGALAAAALIHRWASQSLLTAGLALLAPLGVLGQMVAPSGAVIWIAMLGIAGGATITIALSLFGLRTRDHHRAASLSGMAQSVGYLLAAFGPVMIGILHDALADWTVPLLVLSGIGLAEVLFGFLAGRDRFVETGGRLQ